jgi:PKD repeat protein
MILRSKKFFFYSLLLISFRLGATHIVGSTLHYTQLNDSTYEISLRLYRDCNSSNGNPAAVLIRIRDQNGNVFSPSRDITVGYDSILSVPSYLPICIANPGICIEEIQYNQIVTNLYPLVGGYHLYYQYCCRASYYSNITNPLSTGISAYARISGTALVNQNSSPRWNLKPPLFECQGNSMNYNSGATDADGDSLVYSYYTPYSDPVPSFPSGIATFSPVGWQSFYAATNPCGGPVLTMNSQTGFISGVPQNIGVYVAGVKCEEFRNGQKIGEIVRDYPFFVVSCAPMPVALFSATALICLGDTIQFTNSSSVATNYFWDFGDTAIANDTSVLVNPFWQYAQAGVYNVMLIADPGAPCADTMVMQVIVEEVRADWQNILLAYAGQPVNFTDSSFSSTGAPIVSWNWNFGDNTTSTQQNPAHIYIAAGTYTVTLTVISANGCSATFSDTLRVDPANGSDIFMNEKINFYPNPAKDLLWFSGLSDASWMTVSDLTGRILISQYVISNEPLYLHGMRSGVYLITVENEDGKFTGKLIIHD